MSIVKIKSIKSAKSLKNKTVLVRCDLDIPLKGRGKTLKKETAEKHGNFNILNDARLEKCVPTINYLLKKKVKQIILIGHRGRPGGKKVAKLSLKPVATAMEKLLKNDSRFKIQDLRLKFIKKIPDSKFQIPDSKIIVLENLRFSDREEKNCQRFAKNLAALGDVYVNESFANSHRAHSSMSAIQSYLPSYAGLHLEQEVKNLSTILKKPKKPLVLIVGGAKIETKLPVIEKLAPSATHILVGGATANNFLKARGMDVKKSLIDKKYIPAAQKLLKKYKNKILLPVDYKWGSDKILDINHRTIILFNGIIKSARTIIWSGPLGYFEDKKFSRGTLQIRDAILSNTQAKIVVGGGETEDVFKDVKLPKNIFISSGGGAMLEFLSSKNLPGLQKT